jgi:hypothetical protein
MVLGGGAFGTMMAWSRKRLAKKLDVDSPVFDEGEVVRKAGLANHFKGVEGVGGKLYLTDKRLRFRSHRLNVQVHDESVALSEIGAAQGTRTLGIIPNGLRITLRSGEAKRFVIEDRSAWLEELSHAGVRVLGAQG